MNRIKTIGLCLLLLLAIPLFSADNLFRVLSYGEDYTEIEFSLSDYEIIETEVDGVIYTRIYHPEAGYLMNEGLPELLTFSTLLSLPDQGSAKIKELRIIETKKLVDINIFPSQGFDLVIDEKVGFIKNEDFYVNGVNYPQESIQLSSPSVMRHARLASMTLYPFSYNPAENALAIVTKAVIKITYNRFEAGENEITDSNNRISKSFDEMFSKSLINYEQFRNPLRNYQEKSLLVIYHHNAVIRPIVEEYVNWKRDKGYQVTYANTATMNTANAIRNYIQNAYDNWDNPPEYVVFIGGGNGSLAVPTFTVHFGKGDHPYTLLAGNDDLPDVFVGRISVADLEGLATVWSKIKNYEKTPYLENIEWYDRNLLVGDPTTSGISVVNTNKYIKEIMQRHYDDYSFVEVYNTPFVSQINNAINSGVSFFNFRGLELMAGWTPNPTNLWNNYKLHNATLLTCYTLDFNGTKQVEPLFRMGTPNTPKGAVTATGMTTNMTATAFNNCVTGGIYSSIFNDDVRTMGEAVTKAKLFIWQVYANSHPAYPPQYSQWLNLIGDPSMNIWVQKPKELMVNYSEAIPLGSNSLEISVRDAAGIPVKNALVSARRSDIDFQKNLYTDELGEAILLFNTDLSGEITLTVTKPDYIPHLGSFNINLSPAVSYNSHLVNGDFLAGSRVDFLINIKNHRETTANNVQGTITSGNQFVTIINNSSSFGSILPNQTSYSNAHYTIEIAPNIPVNLEPMIELEVSDSFNNVWTSFFKINVINGNLIPVNYSFDGNGILDPNEQAELIVDILNDSSIIVPEVYGILRGGGFGLSIPDSVAYFGTIAPGIIVPSIDNHFIVSASSYVIPGMSFNLELLLYNEYGFELVRSISIPIGEVTVDSPFGPDNYGYWIYDIGDDDFVDAPVYDWIEISPPLGGNGVNTGLQSDHDNLQTIVYQDLPFNFTFYGIEYDEITICANGWISFGRTEQTTQRNWRLPGPLGPAAMIAAFWDNLSLQNGAVYTYYNQIQNSFIIQWQNALNVMQNAPETFQIVLYDPAHHITGTGDGPIKIQYRIFNNVNNGANSPSGIGNWGNYATIGIADHNCSDGLEYSFNNRYPQAARPLSDESALYITTGSIDFNAALIQISNYELIGDGVNTPESGETITIDMTLTNIGGELGEDVTAVLSSNNPFVNIVNNEAAFGDIGIGQTSTVASAYSLAIASNIPHLHRVNLNLAIYLAGELIWNDHFGFDVNSPNLSINRPLFYDPLPNANNNGLINAGEVIKVYAPISNNGGTDAENIDIQINSNSNLFTINSISLDSIPLIRAGETVYPEISVYVSHSAVTGDALSFDYVLTSNEYTFNGTFNALVGGLQRIQLGTGNAVNSNISANPLNIFFRSLRGQTLYTAQELLNNGVIPNLPITRLGYYTVNAPAHSLPNFLVRMKHTNSNDLNNHDNGPFTTVYTNYNYTPTAGRWDMLTLSTPFTWNGIDNILVDTAFSLTSGFSSTGQQKIYNVPNSYRYTRSDNFDQANAVTTTLSNDKPQIQFIFGVDENEFLNRPVVSGIELIGYQMKLDWSVPALQDRNTGRAESNRNDRYPDSFRIYRNGILLDEIASDETEYFDGDFNPSENYFYYITSVFNERESLPSNVVNGFYHQNAPVEYSIEQGIYYEPITVTLSCSTPGTAIYYSLDGRDPTENCFLYQEPLTIPYHTQINARAFQQDWVPSEMTTAVYAVLNKPMNLAVFTSEEISYLSWDAPAVNPDNRAENINNRRRVSNSARNKQESDNNFFRNDLIGFRIYATEANSEELVALIDLPAEQLEFAHTDLTPGFYQYRVHALYNEGESQSSNEVITEVKKVSNPQISPLTGAFYTPVNVIIRCATHNASIFYTLNGTEPTRNDFRYLNPITINTHTTLKVRAFKYDWIGSDVVTHHYAVLIPPFNLSATPDGNLVHLQWEAPETIRNERLNNTRKEQRDTNSELRNEIVGYQIFRSFETPDDPIMVTELEDTYESFTDVNNLPGTYFYSIKSVYPEGLSPASNIVSVDLVRVDIPHIDPVSGSYYGNITVSIRNNNDDAAIYYTTDGSEPTEEDILYETPFIVNRHTTVKAKAFKQGLIPSQTFIAIYAVLHRPVNLTANSIGSNIHLAWDSPLIPDLQSTRNSSRNTLTRESIIGWELFRSINNPNNMTRLAYLQTDELSYIDEGLFTNLYYYGVKAIYDEGASLMSQLTSAQIWRVNTPQFDPQPGHYSDPVRVFIRANTPKSIIYYTTDGSEPNENSLIYNGQAITIGQNTTIKSYAIRYNWLDSDIITGEYIIGNVSVDENISHATRLFEAYPNPFNPKTNISFNLQQEEQVKINIYNIAGKSVRKLIDTKMPAGHHSVEWDGTDDTNNALGSGVYFYRMTTSDYQDLKKLILLK